MEETVKLNKGELNVIMTISLSCTAPMKSTEYFTSIEKLLNAIKPLNCALGWTTSAKSPGSCRILAGTLVSIVSGFLQFYFIRSNFKQTNLKTFNFQKQINYLCCAEIKSDLEFLDPDIDNVLLHL